jgi:hypothetical protein
MNKTRDVRLKALWRDDPSEAPLTLDLRIDASTGEVVSHWDLFGAFDLDGDARRPFVLRRDGVLDFGATEGARWRTDLRSVAVRIGARFCVHWNEADSGEYEIVKIAALGSKDDGK